MSSGVGLSLGPSPGGAHQHNGNRAPTHPPTPQGGSVGSKLHRGHTEACPRLCRGSCQHGGHAVQNQEVCWRRGAKIYNRNCCFLSTLCSWRPPLLRPQSPIHPQPTPTRSPITAGSASASVSPAAASLPRTCLTFPLASWTLALAVTSSPPRPKV